MRSFFNPCWFSLLHLSQNLNCGIVHFLISSTFSTDEHGISFGVRFISRNALSSMFTAGFEICTSMALDLAFMQLPVIA